MTRVLVCGGRDYDDADYLNARLDAEHEARYFTAVIEGEAAGADTLARQWALGRGVPVQPFPADWERYGRAAGPVRNRQMLVEGKPDLVIAFHHDIASSKGTKNMVEQANKAGIPVLVMNGW